MMMADTAGAVTGHSNNQIRALPIILMLWCNPIVIGPEKTKNRDSQM